MAITKISPILLVVCLIVGIIGGYAAGFAVYQPKISKLQSKLSESQSQITTTYNSIPAYIETSEGVYPLTKAAFSQIKIDAEPGEKFTIILESNPSTGYQWQLAKPLDESIIKLVGSEYKAPESAGEGTPPLGATGKEAWTFETVSTGTVEISMKYIRSWEENTLPEKERTFIITIGSKAGIITRLANVIDIDILLLESFPVQVNVIVHGELPDSCTEIGEITTRREGNTFFVTVTTSRPADAVCAQVITPFEEIVKLDATGLKAGVYTVNVNGVEDTFELQVDNILPE